MIRYVWCCRGSKGAASIFAEEGTGKVITLDMRVVVVVRQVYSLVMADSLWVTVDRREHLSFMERSQRMVLLNRDVSDLLGYDASTWKIRRL